MSELPVIFIAGPTASGKTKLAMQLADKQDVALISVDAAQVYQGMDIGTAKLDKAFQNQYPHALIDIRDPAQVYDAAQFVSDAKACITQAHEQGKLPVLVGGTLFYFSALENGVSALPTADDALRKHLAAQAQELGWQTMYRNLRSLDPTICQTIKMGDRQRIARAFEIHHITGQVPSVVMAQNKPQPLNQPLLKFNLFTPERSLLHQRISQRFDVMLAAGLVAEVETLKARDDTHSELPSMRCVGYRQVWQYLQAEFDYGTMRAKGIAATRQLAKRQLTWLRHQRGQIWLSSENNNNIDLILPFLSL